MAWTAPRTWVTSEVPTAANFNTHVRDNLSYLKDVLDGAAYQNLTPTYAGTDALPLYLLLRKARGSLGSPTVVSSGDNIGQLAFRAYDGAAYQDAAIVQAFVDGTPGSGDMPGRLSFWTTPDGSATAVERMRLDNAGALLIGATTRFNTNLLDVAGRAAFDAAGLQIGRDGTAANNVHMVAEAVSAVRTLGVYGGNYGAGTKWLHLAPTGVYVPAAVNNGYGWGGASGHLFFYNTSDVLSLNVAGNTRFNWSNSSALYGETAAVFYTLGARLAVSVGSVVPVVVDRTTNDGTLISLRQDSTEEGSISVSGTTVAYNTFLGCHFTQLKDGQEEPPAGGVVVTTGEMVQSDNVHYVEDVVEPGPGDATPAGQRRAVVRQVRHETRADSAWREVRGETRDTLPHVAGTTAEADPAVYGVWFGRVRDDAAGGSFGKNGRPVYSVAAVGAHECRVTDLGGDVAPGDLLCTSARRYESQRQAGSLITAATLGKALAPVVWAEVEVDKALGYKWRSVPVVLYAG